MEMIAGFYHPFSAGHHRYKNTQIYISRGTGYWGPPQRVASPSEITEATDMLSNYMCVGSVFTLSTVRV